MIISKTYKKTLPLVLAVIALAAVAGWFATNSAQAVLNDVSVDPASTTEPPGVSVTVSIKTEIAAQSGIPPTATGGLGSWDAGIFYDDTVVTAMACTSIAGGGCIITTSGQVDMLGFVGTAYSGVLTLGTITFDLIGTDGESSPVAITVNSFNNANGDPIGPTTTDGVINIEVATIHVVKDFSDNNAADVTISLACTSGATVTMDDNTASEADAADFTISDFPAGTTCTATETVPAGYVEDETDCLNVSIAANTVIVCTITNDTTATFNVSKDFSDNNIANVTVALTCTSGTVTVDDATANEGGPDTADFTITAFAAGTTCTATETVPAGYTSNEATTCLNVAIAITGGPFSCTITNSLNAAVFNVSKNFTNVNTNDVTVGLICTSGTVTVDDVTANEGTPDTADFTIEGFTVGATCTATETVPTGYSENEAACLNVNIAITGGPFGCTITNTPLGLLAWNDNDCDGDVDVADGQWLLTSLLGSPIAQTEPCPDLGGTMLPTPFTTVAPWADTECDGTVNVRDGQYLLSALLSSPIAQTEFCPDASDVDSVIPLP